MCLFFSYVESSRRSRASTHLVLPHENTRSPPHLHANQCSLRPRASEARKGQGRRRIAPVVAGACDANLRSWQPVLRCPWTWMVPLVVGSPHWMRCSAVAFPVAPFLRCFWSLCLGCMCTQTMTPWAAHETLGNCIYIINAGGLSCVGSLELGLAQ